MLESRQQRDIVRLRAHVRGLLPRFARRAEEAERVSVPALNLEELEQGLVHRFLEPEDAGGFGLPFGPFFRIIAEMASACGSTAWTFMLFAVHSWGAQFAPERIRNLLYHGGNPARLTTVFVNGGRLTRLPDGRLQLDGVWPFVTGLHLTDWLAVKALDEQDSECNVFLRRDEVLQANDWHALGLQGTASHSVSVAALVVGEERVVTESEMQLAFRQRADKRASRVAPVPAVVTLGTVAPVLGMTRAAVNGYQQLLQARAEKGEVLPGALERLARMRSQVRAMDLLYRDSLQMLDTRINGKTLSEEAITLLQMHAAWMVSQCQQMVAEILSCSGTRMLASDNPLRRHASGVLTLGTHYLVDYDGISVRQGAMLVRQGLAES